MAKTCFLGSHKWDGCKCSKCGQTRDEGHDWTKNCERCSRCGKTRENVHTWDGCKCSKCGQTRDQGHDWTKDCEKCSRCGRTRSRVHTFRGCKCTVCGKIRDEEHEWEGAVCKICGSPKSAAQLWAEGLAQVGNYHDLAYLVGQYSHTLNEQDKERQKYARLVLLAAGEQAVDAVIEIYSEKQVDHMNLAEILIASKTRRVAIPLVSHLDSWSAHVTESNKLVDFLDKMKAVETAQGLEAFLDRQNSGLTRHLAAKILGRLAVAETTDTLLKALNGDPNVRSGLEDAHTGFAWSILESFDKQRKSVGPKFDTMSESDMLQILESFSSALMARDNLTIDRLQITVKDIGEELNRRGGEAAMRKMIYSLSNSSVVRTIDLLWSGIGSWQG